MQKITDVLGDQLEDMDINLDTVDQLKCLFLVLDIN
jgi:hypothetical protein